MPDILAEDYSKTEVSLAYQIKSKIEGEDLGNVIEDLTDNLLKALAKEVASIFKKVETVPASNQFGLVSILDKSHWVTPILLAKSF